MCCAKEGEGMLFEEDRCPACGLEMSKTMEKGNGGFVYIFRCGEHGIMRRREPTFLEIENWG